MTNEEAVMFLEPGTAVTIYPEHEEAPAWSTTVAEVNKDGSMIRLNVKSGRTDWWVESRFVHVRTS